MNKGNRENLQNSELTEIPTARYAGHRDNLKPEKKRKGNGTKRKETGAKRKETGAKFQQETNEITNQTTISKQYREYGETLQERWKRIYSAIIIDFKATMKNKWVIIITIFAWLWGIIPQIAVVLISLMTAGSGDRSSYFNPQDHLIFYSYLYVFLVLFCGYISAKIVTTEKADRVITLYLCRPITKLDYFLIKYSVLAMVLFLMVVVPNMLLFLITIGLLKMPFMWNIEHLWVLGSILVSGLVLVSVLSLISLAIASGTNKMQWAVAGIYTFLFLSSGMSFIMRDLFDNDYTSLISPWDVFEQFASPLFDTELPFDFPWAVAFTVLVLYVAASLAIILYNINKVEVAG